METGQVVHETTEVRLSREMTVFSVTMIGVGAMIGAGIFVLTGIAAGVAGPGLIAAFLLNGLVTLLTAFAYAELGSCFHDAGGGYLWIKEGLPQPNGFLSGWMSWFAHAVACSLYALGFGAYFGHVLTEGFGLDIRGLPLPLEKVLAVLACLLFAYINFRGASETGKMGNIVTLAKVAVIGVFIAFGLHVISLRTGWQAEFRPFLPEGMSGVFMAMGLTFIAFQGYEVIAQCSEEIVDPRRNIPRAVFWALAIVIPIYLLVAFTAIGGISGNGKPSWQYLGEQREIAMVEAARQFLPGGAVMFLVGGLLSTLSALNATVYSSSRVAFAMGRDANLPDFFARVHPRRHTPHLSIIASVAIVIVMSLLLPIEDVASAADIMFLLIFMQVNVVVIRLRKKRPDLQRGFRIPFVPVLPALGIVTQLFIAFYLIRYSPKAFLSALLWIGAGVVIHYVYASKKEARVVTFRRAVERLARREYRILVCLGATEHVKPLMTVALALARHFDGEVVTLAVVEVPPQTPLTMGTTLPEVKQRRTCLRLAENMADDARVPSRRLIKVTHRLSQGILDTAREEDCNFIILGRSPKPGLGARLVRSSLDRVLSEAPCHVAVVKCEGPLDAEDIAVAIEDGPNSSLAIELLPAFGTQWTGRRRILSVVPLGPAAEQRGLAQVSRTLPDRGLDPRTRVEVVATAPPAEELHKRIGDRDIVIMGESSWTGLSRMFGSTIQDEIAEKSPQLVVLLTAYQPKRKPSVLFRLLTGA